MTRISTPQTLRQKLEILADAAKYDARERQAALFKADLAAVRGRLAALEG